jgi:hypothetical protein
VPGRTIAYAISLDHRAEIDPAAVVSIDRRDAPPVRTGLQLAGRLEQTVLSAADDEVLVLLRLVDVRLGDDGAAADDEAFARGAVVRLDRRGRVQALRLPSGASARSAGTLEYLAGMLQVGLPEGPAEAWHTDERAQEGALRVGYRAEPLSGSTDIRLVKTPEAVVQSSLVANDRVRRAGLAATVSGTMAIDFDPTRGLPLRFDGERRLRVAARVEGTVVVDAVGVVHAELVAVREEAPPRLGAYDAWFTPGHPRAPDAAARRAELEQRAGDATWPELWAALGDAASLTPAARNALLGRLTAFLSLHPDACAAAAHELATLAPDSAAAGMLTAGLVGAGHAEAQAALRTALEAWRGHDANLVAPIASLGGLDAPDDATLDLLRELTASTDDATAGAAELALGAAARRLRADDPARSGGIARPFVEELERGATPARTQQIFSVLGNAGAPELLPIAARALAGPDAKLRGAAAMALRFVAGDEADRLLAHAIAHETDMDALMLTLLAVRFRAPSEVTTRALRARAGTVGDARVEALLAPLLARADAV